MAHSDVESEGAAGAESPRSARWALGLCAAVLYFLIDGLAVVIGAAAHAIDAIALGSPAEPLRMLPWILPLLVLVLPALPLGAYWGRERLAVRAAATALGAGVVLALADGAWRLAPAAIAVAAASFFLVALVGLVNRRSVAAGFAGAFVLRDLALLSGSTGDWADGRTAMLVWAVVVALLGVACVRGWQGAPAEDRGESFERRAGGLRLRGALALGALLFFELARGPVPARGGFEALVLVAVAALAWLVVVRGVDVHRHRVLAVVLGLIATAAAVVALFSPGEAQAVAGATVLGHAAALVLLDRALAPVSGRRSGGNIASGLLLLAALAIGFALSQTLDSAVLHPVIWVLVAGVVLVVANYLTPRPPRAPAALPDGWSLPIALALPLLALLAANVRA